MPPKTRCPWSPPTHDAVPDPAAAHMVKGDRATCGECDLMFVVTAVNPYKLARLPAESALAIQALARRGPLFHRAAYAKLLARKEIKRALAEQLAPTK